ncbi:hypothetical protein KK062_24120 [Fulvivirgaceae bacterium PWU5]|uniref:Uncharacterized protein n=1 Tax=Dawidia cretensis TaxID=2782350 RepID=A0AAP2E1F4_9BACT|nr:hypothetical protein [Dawidia cretensis]MBT1711350.1 hypothetical protein [Dawidia cretensis]
MRTKLAAEAGNRKKFQGTFSRLGKKVSYTGYSEDTILLVQITDMATGLVVADHVWFSYTKGFEQVRLSEGVRVEFEARVKEYKKGYVNPALGRKRKTSDFKLSHPTRIRLVAEQ